MISMTGFGWSLVSSDGATQSLVHEGTATPVSILNVVLDVQTIR